MHHGHRGKRNFSSSFLTPWAEEWIERKKEVVPLVFRMVDFVSPLKGEEMNMTNVATAAEAREARPRVSSVSFALQDLDILADVLGPMDRNIDYIERKMSVSIGVRGPEFHIEGMYAEDAQQVIREMYRCVECDEQEITTGFIDAKIREISQMELPNLEAPESNVHPHAFIKTRKKTIVARNQSQTRYIMAMQRDEMVFGLGPAGTGKTYLAVAQAVVEFGKAGSGLPDEVFDRMHRDMATEQLAARILRDTSMRTEPTVDEPLGGTPDIATARKNAAGKLDRLDGERALLARVPNLLGNIITATSLGGPLVMRSRAAGLCWRR